MSCRRDLRSAYLDDAHSASSSAPGRGLCSRVLARWAAGLPTSTMLIMPDRAPRAVALVRGCWHGVPQARWVPPPPPALLLPGAKAAGPPPAAPRHGPAAAASARQRAASCRLKLQQQPRRRACSGLTRGMPFCLRWCPPWCASPLTLQLRSANMCSCNMSLQFQQAASADELAPGVLRCRADAAGAICGCKRST